MTNATLTKLTSADYPWVWALRILKCDPDKFGFFLDAFKLAIPARSRKWDADGKRWLLRQDAAELAARLLAEHGLRFSFEDESPPAHRQLAMTRLEAACTLYLQPDAPSWAIDAVYRAAAKQAHPDAGGSTEEMQRINAAVEVLRAEA